MEIKLILGWIIAIVSIIGWAAEYAYRLRTRPELGLPLSICTIILTVYVFGLVNALMPGAWIAACSGCVLFLWTLIKRRDILKGFFSPGILFLALFAVFLGWQVHDDALSHNDDFNHWAVIVKNMLLRNSYPDPSVTAIDFSSYPPGSATFIYYINTITMGDISEGRFIFAQNLMILCLLTPVFAVMQPKDDRESSRPCLYLMLFACALLMFLYEFRALIVDVLNGVIGFAAAGGALHLRKEPRKAILYAVPVTAVGLLVKYSNIYYAGLTFLILLSVCVSAKKRGEKSCFSYLCIWAGFSILMVGAWFVHVRLVFGGVADTHSMNIGRIRDVLNGWSRADVIHIARVCLRMATNPTKSSVLLTLFMNAAAVGLAVVNRCLFRRPMKRIIGSLCMADMAYIGYQVMLFCAYVLSFPRDEAMRGASYGRYNMSIMIWIIGFMSYVCIDELRKLSADRAEKKSIARIWKAVYGTGFAVITAAALIVTGEGSTLFQEVAYDGTWRQAADTVLADEELVYDDNTRFFILAADPDAKQVSSIFHYKVNRRVDYAWVGEINSTEELMSRAADDDYIIVLEEDDRIKTLIGGIGWYPAGM